MEQLLVFGACTLGFIEVSLALHMAYMGVLPASATQFLSSCALHRSAARLTSTCMSAAGSELGVCKLVLGNNGSVYFRNFVLILSSISLPAALPRSFMSYLVVFAGPCTRCEMICMDQRTGLKVGPEPLLTLASFRRSHGRILFGILLTQQAAHVPGTSHSDPFTAFQHPLLGDYLDGGNHTGKAVLADPGSLSNAMRGPSCRDSAVQQNGTHSLRESLEAQGFPMLRIGMRLVTSS